MAKLAFNKRYFLLAFSLLIVEFLIERYAYDDFVRPYLGDFLIVIFLYSLLKAFFNIPVKPAAITVLIISYITEILQYLNILNLLGLRHSATANLLLGNYFSWIDILAYSLGIAITIAVELACISTNKREQLFI